MGKPNWRRSAEEGARKVDFLGAQLVALLGRFHGARVAHGELAPEALVSTIQHDVQAIHAAMQNACVSQNTQVS